MIKKRKHRRNGFSADSKGGEDDFTVVDLDVMLDQAEPSPVSLNHFFDDEETINSLLVNSVLDVNDEWEETDRDADALVVDLADDFSGFDQFVIESIEQAEENRLTETEEVAVSDVYLSADCVEIPDKEDAIDRLLVDAGFDANDELGEADSLPNFERFLIEPVAQAAESRLAEVEEIPVSDIYSRGEYDEIPDEDTIDELLIEASDESKENGGVPNALVIGDISRNNVFGVNFKKCSTTAVDKSVSDSEESELAHDKVPSNAFLVKEENYETLKQEQAFSQTTYQDEALYGLNNDAEMTSSSSFRTEQEAIKKQTNGHQDKVKKSTVITYASLGFAIAALLSTVVMGVIVSSLQTKVSRLTELVSIIEEDMSGVAEKNSTMEIYDSDPSIEQPNKKVTGHLEEFSNPQSPVSVLEKKKQAGATVEKATAEKKAGLQKQIIVPAQSLLEQSKSNMASIPSQQVTSNKSLDKKKTKTPDIDKKKPSETTLKIPLDSQKTKNAKTASGWSVNLTAYKELSDAKRKAAKFIQKGIPVKVIAVDMNNTTWYRLKVGGFKNKEKANSYAAKIKKSLNLDVVFMGNS